MAVAKRRRSVTIRHVAADAGVSLQTVSRVVNKAPNVRPEMMQRVQESIDRLGYVPSLAAQRLAGAHSYFILALNDRERTIADWRSRQGTDWVDQMLLGGMLTCAEHGYRMIIELIDTHSDQLERELLAAIDAVQPDGIVLTPPHSGNPRIVGLLEKQGISFARIGSTSPGGGIRLTMDDERAGRIATEHLIDLGHRRIGFVAGPADYELSGWRVAGWRAAMAAAGLPAAGLLATGDFTHASGRAAAETLLGLADRVTALVVSNDQMTLGAMEAARERGVAIPAALSLVSFDDTPAMRYTAPPMTAVVQPIAEVASRAVQLIIAQRQGGDVPATPVTVAAGLVVRDTTAPPPAAR
ncbi:LacI family transcriptional regulator [Sphingomonas sp. A2-49]|uniref:LacI family DNA-binding transcriptional regulator n=1 Tax=Sphingomonas sp. A2-49 TaxID=1391375 RepID=UPI0021D18DFD|nr:LacI family DNA-binding transcriptional regulator [Sphingomonas sp. A2-49]MCU6453765.1 LacI family transcriptional regulator [Sphingomonas sp. A2-49]